MSMNLFEFWEKIELPSKVKEKVLKLELEEKDYLDICHIYQECHENYYQFLLEKEESALWFLLIYSRMACEVYDKYSALGISEDVFWATFKDITFWCKNYEQEYGQIGLGAYEWFHRHIDMTLFRLGRLQFEPMVMESTVGDGIETIPEGTSVINIHIPQGAVPKDGPSAGITMATAMLSAITKKKVDCKLAMTGEITLRGKVLPIGGLKEKLLAAKTAGIKKVLVPDENRKDVEEISTEITDGIEIVYVTTMDEVLTHALA